LTDPETLTIICLTFVLAGLVKGIIGMGLPTVSLVVLTVAIDLPSAMALLLIPSLVTNIWQAMAGGNLTFIVARLWPFLVAATLSVWIGAIIFSRVDTSLMSALLGLLVVTYAISGLAGYKLRIEPHHDNNTGPLTGVIFGTVNGVLTGMTGSFVMPGVMYLQAIGLSRDVLIQAMGLLFTVSTVALALALQRNQILNSQLGWLSLLAVIPAIVGMMAGQRLRRHLSESQFRSVFFVSLLALGVSVGVQSFFQ
jgi:uncharacterized membrane protein YfcA